MDGSWYDRSRHYSTPKTINSQTKFSKLLTGNGKANKKKQINKGEMQLASVTRKKITIKNNLHWDNWPVYLTTTTVVLIVLWKINSFRAYVNRQETSGDSRLKKLGVHCGDKEKSRWANINASPAWWLSVVMKIDLLRLTLSNPA